MNPVAKSLRHLAWVGALLCATPAFAAYPLSGTWTYDNVSGKGPAPSCGARQMEFSGALRHDTEGGVHDYRNVSVFNIGLDRWRVTDEFTNGMINGRVTFTLKRLDEDHIEIRIAAGGATSRLRRCG